ncbi:MAG TPA: NotI family restriction endonuclease [Ktedonobacterales bacterium]|jgi:hypothetical protein
MSGFGNHPLEFYGKRVAQETIGDFASVMAMQQCPFLGRRCVKQRKSDSNQTIGACAVGFQGNPLIICPHRFIARNQIFLDCFYLLTQTEPGLEYFAVPEISMPGGNIDYFLVATNGFFTLDYVGIEIQSLDTTGSGGIWTAREDVRQGLLAPAYPYGINWRMSAKTILMQMLHKADSFQGLGKKLVLVVQTPFFNYLAREFRTDHLRPANSEDTVHFHIYDSVLLNSELHLALKQRKSTSAEGIAKILVLGRESEIAPQEILDRIKAKMVGARQIQPPPPIAHGGEESIE